MAECSFHKGVETSLSCAECGRAICPKEMVLTQVGYKCPVCAKPSASQLRYIKPKQFLLGAAAALGAAVVVGLILGEILSAVGFSFFLIDLAYGAMVGEAARRGSGGHRGAGLAGVAGAAAFLGGILGGFDLISAGIAVVGAVAYLMQNRF